MVASIVRSTANDHTDDYLDHNAANNDHHYHYDNYAADYHHDDDNDDATNHDYHHDPTGPAGSDGCFWHVAHGVPR